MRVKLFLGALLVFVSCVVAGSKAAEVKLVFVTMSPPDSRIAKDMLEPWVSRINEKGKGIVQIDVRHGTALANFSNVYSRVQDDVIQIGFGLQGMMAGQFAASSVIELPIWDDQEKAAGAFWRLYEMGALGKDYEEIVPFILSPTAQGGVHYREKPASITDLTGQKIMVIGKVPAQMIASLGGTPQSIPIFQVYEALQRGTVDATVLAWTSFQPYKLGEVTKFHIQVAAGSAASMVFMSKKKFDALPAAAQKILNENSGLEASRASGRWWREEYQRGFELVKNDQKHEIAFLDEKQKAVWQKAKDIVEAEWVKQQAGNAEVLRLFREYIAEQ